MAGYAIHVVARILPADGRYLLPADFREERAKSLAVPPGAAGAVVALCVAALPAGAGAGRERSGGGRSGADRVLSRWPGQPVLQHGVRRGRSVRAVLLGWIRLL